MNSIWFWPSFVFVGSFIGVEYFRRLCLKYSWLDIPNSRSSHVRPTPRGGGAPVVLAYSVAAWFGAMRTELALILVPALVVAILGFVDDRIGLRAIVRLIGHFIAASVAVAVLRSTGHHDPVISVGGVQLASGFTAVAIGVLFVVWMTNLYNFMDGIDGIAGIQVLTIGTLSSVFSVAAGDVAHAHAYISLAAGAAGFLWWNWSPARIFMGDVGSGFFGFTFGALALSSIVRGSLSIEVILILHATFLADTTYTLLKRIARGERPQVAHRTHAYQKMTGKGWSHKQVCLAYAGANVFWLGPVAWLVTKGVVPGWTGLLAAYIPLFGICAATRAGEQNVTA